jgi:NAD(P)-dependent dehydrogenase (short-subunit alcohol dehydrogenase family)
MFDLTGKVALVTGGTTGIGREIALALARAGATVAVNGRRDVDAGATTVDELRALGVDASFVLGDVTDADAVEAMVASVVNEHGGLDIAVNNALQAYMGGDPLNEKAAAQWARSISSFMNAPFYCCRAEAAHMSQHGGGSIINVSSIMGRVSAMTTGHVGTIAYATAKAGLTHMTRALAAEWAPVNIRVNSISPGFVMTRATAYYETAPEHKDQLVRHTPMARLGEPSEIGGAVVYLASDAASYTTGADIVIDGGYTTW